MILPQVNNIQIDGILTKCTATITDHTVAFTNASTDTAVAMTLKYNNKKFKAILYLSVANWLVNIANDDYTPITDNDILKTWANNSAVITKFLRDLLASNNIKKTDANNYLAASTIAVTSIDDKKLTLVNKILPNLLKDKNLAVLGLEALGLKIYQPINHDNDAVVVDQYIVEYIENTQTAYLVNTATNNYAYKKFLIAAGWTLDTATTLESTIVDNIVAALNAKPYVLDNSDLYQGLTDINNTLWNVMIVLIVFSVVLTVLSTYMLYTMMKLTKLSAGDEYDEDDNFSDTVCNVNKSDVIKYSDTVCNVNKADVLDDSDTVCNV